MRPAQTPVGLHLARVSRLVSRTFDDSLTGTGGSLPVWLIMLNLKAGRRANQRELAEAVGLTAATLTHHLNAMEADGLVTRRRDPANRRSHVVELTEAGEAMFLELREVAVEFDKRLRSGLNAEEVAAFDATLSRLAINVAGSDPALVPPIAAPLGPATTDRLDLRRFEPEDLDGLAVVFADDEVWRYPYGRGLSLEETAAFLRNQIEHWDRFGFGCWLVEERASGRTAGYVGLSIPAFLPEILPAVEVGWRLHPDFWGRGYATEAATIALDRAFGALGLDQVCSIIDIGNDASIAVAERLGMRKDRSIVIPGNERFGPADAYIYVVTSQDWADRAG